MSVTRRNMIGAALAPAIWPLKALARQRYRVGLALPLTGVQAEVAQDLETGYRLAFDVARAKGLDVELLIEDDKADPALTAKHINAFAHDPSILATSGIVGTPNALKALPVAISNGLPVVGIRSAAQSLRDGSPTVFHLRCSFEEEISRMMVMIAGGGFKRLSVLYSDDAFGRGALAHTRIAAAAHGVQVVNTVSAERSGKDAEQRALNAVDPSVSAHALLILMITRPMLTALQTVRKTGAFRGPTFAMSFCATRAVSSKPMPEAAGLGIIAAFPRPIASTLPLAKEYRDALIAAGEDDSLNHSLTAFEGFFYGSVLSHAIAGAGAASRSALLASLNRVPTLVGGAHIQWDGQKVGHRYLEIVHKDGTTGTFRA